MYTGRVLEAPLIHKAYTAFFTNVRIHPSPEKNHLSLRPQRAAIDSSVQHPTEAQVLAMPIPHQSKAISVHPT